MSFSADVKEELAKVESAARHCQIAELAAIAVYAGAVRADSGWLAERFQPDNPHVADRWKLLLDKLFPAGDDEKKILQTIKYNKGDTTVDALIIKSHCCRRAFLRGAFLSIGSMSAP